MKALLKSPKRVLFEDCDPLNHLNNTKYINYLLNAREEQLRANYQVDLNDLVLKEKQAYVILKTQISYLRPAVMGEVVICESKCIQCFDRFCKVEYVMYDKNMTQLKCVMWCDFAYIDLRTQKLIPQKKELYDLMQNIMYPIQEPTFDKRVRKLRSMKGYEF